MIEGALLRVVLFPHDGHSDLCATPSMWSGMNETR
jgi:hypothetical protein